MKRWHVRSLVIVILGVLGMAALAFRPALVPDVVEWGVEPVPLQEALGAQNGEDRAEMEVEYRWAFKKSPTHTVFWHEGGQDAFALLEGNPEWTLRFKVHNGMAVVDGDLPQMRLTTPRCQLQARFIVFNDGFHTMRLPNGKVHTQREIMLLCELTVTPSCWGRQVRSIAAQQVVADYLDNAMDLVEPHLSPLYTRGMTPAGVVSAQPSGLPERFCGNTCERELTRFLYQLAAIDRKGLAEYLTPRLEARGRELVDTFADTEKPWPECWGDAAYTARINAQKLTPLLQRFKDEHAFGSQKLLDFVNGPVFKQIFGEPLMEITLPPAPEKEQPKEEKKDAA